MHNRNRRPRLTASQMRKQREARLGMAIICAVAVMFGAMLYAGYSIDKAHGISAGQSLDAWGL